MILPPEWPSVRPYKPRNNWVVDGRPFLKREFFKTEAEGYARRDTMRVQVRNGSTAPLTPEKVIETTTAEDIVKPWGISVIDACRKVAAQMEKARKLGNVRMDAALAEWLKNAERRQETGELAKKTVQEVKAMTKILLPVWGKQFPHTITSTDVAAWIDGLAFAARTRANIRTKLGQFFTFCRRQGWVESNPCELYTVKVKASEVEIFSVEDCQGLVKRIKEGLTHIDPAQSIQPDPECMPFTLVSLLAGLRPGEALALRWEHIHWDTKEIEVRSETSKGRRTRFVPLNPALEGALKPYRQKIGNIIPVNFRKRWDAVRKGLKWPPDVLRHTFASYWLANYLDRAELAEIMGNTVEVIRNHYRRAIPREKAQKFWTYFLELTPREERPALAVLSAST